MRFTGRVPLGILAIAFTISLTSAAPAEREAVTKQVHSASLARTVMTMSFDETATLDAAASPEFNDMLSANGSSILAIEGRGMPQVSILNYELGATVRSMALDSDELPATAAELITISEPAILHDLRIVSVNVAAVMRDEAGAFRAVREVEFAVETSGAGGANTLDNADSFSSAFYPLYRTSIDNLDEIHPYRSLRAPGRYLVLGPSALMNQLTQVGPFQDWLELKQQKGFTMLLRTLADIGDSTDLAIRDYVEGLYHEDGPDLEYALLLGDVSGQNSLTTHFMQNPESEEDVSVGDNYFFTVDGDDYISDIFHARVSGRSIQEYIPYFSKVVNYETNPPRDDRDWFESASFVAGNYADGTTPTYPVTPVWNMNWCRETLMGVGCITDADTFYFHDPSEPQQQWTTSIINDISEGVCAVFYRGWASQQLWQYPYYGNAEIQLTNVGARNPAVYGIVCGSGDFDSSPCMGELWTTGVGSVANPDGAIIYYGASDLRTNTRHNNAMLAAITRGILDGVRSGGALAMAGKLEVWKQFPLERPENSLVHFYGFHVFNLLGDPETQTYICQPGTFEVNAPENIAAGNEVVTVDVMFNGLPVNEAKVSIRNNETGEVFSEVTDLDGRAELPVVVSGGNASLLIWRAGYFQYHEEISVSNDAFNFSISDAQWDTNGDGLPGTGETVSFNLIVENHGQEASPALTLTTEDDRVNITAGTSAPTTIPNGGSANIGPFTVELTGMLPDGADPLLDVQFEDGFQQHRALQIPIYAPDPQIWAYTDDADSVASPGDTVNFNVEVVNRGSFDGPISATVTSWDNAVIITSGELNWASTPYDEVSASSNTLTFSVPENVTTGRQVMLRFDFSMNGEYFTRKQNLITIGHVDINDPTGPDLYGYYAYEDIDLGFDKTPTYEWADLNPDSGGNATNTYFVRDDTHFGIELPMPFTFYGEAYDSLWICSNGWVSLETATLPEFRNWEIPSPIGPPSMICPYWDDLISFEDDVNYNNSEHEIWTRHEGNRFIVQWQTLNRRGLEGASEIDPSTDFCTFQMILEYNGAQDGDILCLYKQISNIDFKQNYATIGIQNSNHRDGLGLTYANFYLASVDAIRAGRAIRFSTTPPDEFLDADDNPASTVAPVEFALHPAYPNPFNPVTELNFDLPQTGDVSLRVYDILGRETAKLLDRSMTAGSHSITFDAAGLPSGLYFARLTSGGNFAVQKLMLVK